MGQSLEKYWLSKYPEMVGQQAMRFLPKAEPDMDYETWQQDPVNLADLAEYEQIFLQAGEEAADIWLDQHPDINQDMLLFGIAVKHLDLVALELENESLKAGD